MKKFGEEGTGMDLNWYQSLLFGLISGITEILPVSSQAHRILLLDIFGRASQPEFLRLMTDLGIVAALYYACQNHIIRILRARRLSRVPKRHRKRPLDTTSLLDMRLIRTMIIPIVLSMFLYQKAQSLAGSKLVLATFMLLNGVILYIPQFFRGANRDSRTMSSLHGLMIGLGGSSGIVPGMSSVAGAYSVASLCGVDRGYSLNIVLLMDMIACAGLVVFDALGLMSVGLGGIAFGTVMLYILAGIVSFFGATLTIKLLRNIISEISFDIFAYYCWGVALFTFIMNLLA